MAPSQGASRSTTCISALPFSSHTPHGALSPRNRPGPAAPSPQGPCGAPDAALPSQPPPLRAGAQAARAIAVLGYEEAEAAPGSWRQSRPQHRPSCPCSRAALPCPGHHPQRQNCMGEPQPESRRGKKGSCVEAGILTSVCFTESPTRCERRKRALGAIRPHADAGRGAERERARARRGRWGGGTRPR